MIFKIFSKKEKKYFDVLIDTEDFDLIKHYKWNVTFNPHSNSYEIKTTIYYFEKQKTIYLHRLIMKAKKGEIVDHINHNKFDNRKSKLRICTIRQNNMNKRLNKRNKSGVKGVCWNKKNKAFYVHVGNIYVGLTEDINKAKNMYNKKAKEIFKEYARLN